MPLTAIALLLLLPFGCASMPASRANDEAAVIQTLHDACKAYLDGDVNRMRELLTEDFTLTDADAVITTREDDIRAAQGGSLRYTMFENRDMNVRLHGNSAVVTGITEVRGNAGDTPFAAKFQFTDTVVYENGRWRVAASHISRLPPS